MNNKPVIIISVIGVIALAVIVVLFQNKKEADRGGRLVLEQKRECASVPEDAKDVGVSLIKNQEATNNKLVEYRVSLESTYPVNVAGIAFSFDQQSLKFVSADFKSSVFPIQAPTDTLPAGIKFNRGIAGTGAGLVGVGDFGTFTFERLTSGQGTEPIVDGEMTDAFFNNGCAEKATIII